MSTTTAKSVTTAHCRNLLPVLLLSFSCLLLTLTGCATREPSYNKIRLADGTYLTTREKLVHDARDQSSIAVLGVVSAVDKMRDFQRRNNANKLEKLIRSQGTMVPTLAHNQLLQVLGGTKQVSVILDRYREYGRLTPADWNILHSVGIPVRYIVVARIDRDEKNQILPVMTEVTNSHGDVLTDRREVTLYHKRSVELAARMYDLRSGEEVWSGAFISEPLNKNSFTEYTGSSISGSVATLLTNSFTNGYPGRDYPPAPSTADALNETYVGVAKAITDYEKSLLK